MNLDLPPRGGASVGLPPTILAPVEVARGLAALPAPRHLFEYVTRTRHLHHGFFEGPADTLAQAQDRLIQRVARRLARGSLVADVAGGLAGRVRLPANLGHRV